MERSFLDYAMTVITARALPDVRDGLKPVQRRILWGMHDIGARPDRWMKCARDRRRQGRHHPHGDKPSTTPWCAWRRTSRCATCS